MPVTQDFLQYVLDQLSGWGDIQVKRMFGCIALYREGLAFGLIADDVVYLKVDDTNRDKYLEAGSEPLKLFKNKTLVPSYYNLPADVLDDAHEFVKWAKEALAIQIKRI